MLGSNPSLEEDYGISLEGRETFIFQETKKKRQGLLFKKLDNASHDEESPCLAIEKFIRDL